MLYFSVKGEIKVELGKNIFDLRKQKGLSQEKLAEQINVTRQTISNWELGTTAPNPEQLILLSKALDKSIDYLVGNETKSVSDKKQEDVSNLKNIYRGFVVLCGTIAGIWSFSANMFRYIEIFFRSLYTFLDSLIATLGQIRVTSLGSFIIIDCLFIFSVGLQRFCFME